MSDKSECEEDLLNKDELKIIGKQKQSNQKWLE